MSQRSEPATGNIYDLGYRRYEGARLGRRHAITSLYFFSLRASFGLGRRATSKIVPIALVIIALAPALIQLGIAAIVASQDITVIKLENYFGFVEITAALFCAAVAPEVIGRDQRTRTLPLYFSRALRRSDYTLAKLAAMTTALLFITLLPEVILLIGHGFASTDQGQFWKDNWGDIPRVLAAGLIAAATMASLSLVVAAQTARRAYATVACVAIYLIPLPVAAIFTNDIGGLAGRLVVFLSPINLLEGATFWVFRASPDSGSILESADFHGWLYGLAALIATLSLHGAAVAALRKNQHVTAVVQPQPGVAPQPATQAPAVEVVNVSRWYGNIVAVNDISFSLNAGITGLLGPNGAGKSTLLHMLSGFLRPSSGTVRVLGQDAWRNPDMYRNVGLVPEREAVYAFLTGRQFVVLSAKLHGLPDPEDAATRAIKLVDLEFAQDRQAGGYSKGMKQRVKIAAALVHNPPVLLLDEPFNGADPRQRLHMIDMLEGMAAGGCTIVFSSHILEEVERLAENVLVVVSGRLAASGDFREIRHLMTDRPHTFTIRSSDNRKLAAALVADPAIFGVELNGERLIAQTSEFSAFTLAVAKVARAASVTLFEVLPTDESLESVFSYLVRR